MAVKSGDTVKVEYEGFFDGGEIFDSTDAHGGEPLEFTVGAHQVVPGFENGVIGKELNEEFKIRLEPEDAYGPYDPEAIKTVPKENFPANFEPQVGMMLQIEQAHGDHSHNIPVVVKDISDTEITLDFNHPMAGKILNFKMKVVEIK